MKSSILLFIAISICCSKSSAQGTRAKCDQVDTASLPVPREKQQLFYLQRDPNTNTVVYTLNTKDGKLDEDDPVDAYWILYEEDGERKDLSFLQRKLAYGIQHKKLADNVYEIYLASYKNFHMRLAYCPQSKQYEAFASINNRPTIVEKIFVRIDGGSLFKPHIDYIELTGRDSQSGQEVRHFLPL